MTGLWGTVWPRRLQVLAAVLNRWRLLGGELVPLLVADQTAAH